LVVAKYPPSKKNINKEEHLYYWTVADACVVDACRYMESSLALAALHVGGGDSAAAEAVLSALDEAVAAHQLSLPEGQLQQVGPKCTVHAKRNA
jgi:hypothetical protein